MSPGTLRRHREALGLSQRKLGALCGSRAKDPGRTVRFWEAGQAPIPAVAVMVINRLTSNAARRERRRKAAERAEPVENPA